MATPEENENYQHVENDPKGCKITLKKGPVKLIKRVKIAHSFLQSVSNQFHVNMLSLPV